jgi:uncharacterized protein (TIGR02271 family)
MQANTNQTVVGIFDDYSKAESVARELTNAGIPRDQIEVKSNFMTGAAGRSTEYEERHEEGGIAGFFHRLFGGHDDDESTRGHYAEAVRRGNAVVCVSATEALIDRAAEIMNAAGAVDLDRHVEKYRETTGYERHDPKAPAYSYEEATRERQMLREGDETTAIPVVEEELEIGKRVVRRGGVRVYSRVVEKPVEQDINLREEHVKVERRNVDRPTTAADTDRLRDSSVEVTEMAEEPVVRKRARVREEVVVGKETTERTEKVRDTVRRTQVEVEQLNGDAGGDYNADFRRDWQDRYANSGEDYNAYEPAYEYGYRTAGDARYKGRNWSDVEEDLRTDYLRNNPNSSWDRMKGAVRYGWEKMTGKR